MSLTKKKLWVILPGGGVKGVFQVGFLQGFMEANKDKYEIDRVYGTSVGAIISPLVAAGKFQEMYQIMSSIHDITDVFEPWGWLMNLVKIIPIFTKLAAYKRVKLIDRVREIMSKYETEERDAILKKCSVVAWDLLNKEEVWFTGEELDIGMQASSALSLVVPPINYKDRSLTDGWITELIPITKVISDLDKYDGNKEDVTILVVDCSTRKGKKITKVPSDPITFSLELISDSTLQLTMTELRDFEKSHPDTDIHYVGPDTDVFDSGIDFDPAKIKTVYEKAKGFGGSYDLKRKEKLVSVPGNSLVNDL